MTSAAARPSLNVSSTSSSRNPRPGHRDPLRAHLPRPYFRLERHSHPSHSPCRCAVIPLVSQPVPGEVRATASRRLAANEGRILLQNRVGFYFIRFPLSCLVTPTHISKSEEELFGALSWKD